MIHGGKAQLESSLSRRTLVSSLFALSGLCVASCSLLGRSYRYKLFLEIEVDGRRYSTQGVRETVAHEQIAWPDQSTLVAQVTRGEALWIDVPGKPTLFLILPSYDGYFTHEWSPGQYLTKTESRRSKTSFNQYPVTIELEEAQLSPDQIPALVYFRDISRSGSGAFINPLNLSSVYGLGARITRASVSRTHEPIQRKLKKKLPWLPQELKKYRQDSSETRYPGRFNFIVREFYSWRW